MTAVACREGLVGATVRTCLGPTGFRRNDATVTMTSACFFHDVSQHRGGPLTPSKVSMVIICPWRQAGHCLREQPVSSS